MGECVARLVAPVVLFALACCGRSGLDDLETDPIPYDAGGIDVGSTDAVAVPEVVTYDVRTVDVGDGGSASSADAPPPAPGAPRPIAPLSTSTVTSQAPVFRWALPEGADGAQVEIYQDRACTRPVTTFVAIGSSGAPPSSLAHGVYFWRVRGAAGGVLGTGTSPVWEVFVGARTAPVDTSWGTVLDLNGDGFADIAVGAYLSDSGGAVDVYYGGAGGISTTPTPLGSPEGTGQYGYSVASAGDVNGDGYADLIIGAPSGGVSQGGDAYVYLGGPNGLSATPTSLFGSAMYGSSVGISVAGAGDVNGDGFADVVVASGNTTMLVYVSLGSADGLTTPTVFSKGFAYQAAAGAGDINGDGYGDVVLGPVTEPSASGTADVYLGGPDGLSANPIIVSAPIIPRPDGGYQTDSYGAVACAGDLNGDGFADILVGAFGVNAAFVYMGSSAGPSGTPVILRGPGDVNGQFGDSVVSAGDVNGDGFSDLLVGAWAENGAGGSGAAYIFLGGSSGLSTTPLALADPSASALAEAGTEYDMFGYAVGGGGDVNGDGFADVLVGAFNVERAYVFPGSVDGPTTSAATLTGAQGRFGWSLTE